MWNQARNHSPPSDDLGVTPQCQSQPREARPNAHIKQTSGRVYDRQKCQNASKQAADRRDLCLPRRQIASDLCDVFYSPSNTATVAASRAEQSSSGTAAAAATVLESNASLLSVLGARHNFLVMTSILDELAYLRTVQRHGIG